MPTTRSNRGRLRASFGAGVALLSLGWTGAASGASDAPGETIRFEISPRLCTLRAGEKQCDAVVHASWSAPREESLCLVLVGRPQIKRCWEHYADGTYSLELDFAEDLTFQLRDPELQNVLASAVLRVIHEALQYRRRRRQPWNVFE